MGSKSLATAKTTLSDCGTLPPTGLSPSDRAPAAMYEGTFRSVAAHAHGGRALSLDGRSIDMLRRARVWLVRDAQTMKSG